MIDNLLVMSIKHFNLNMILVDEGYYFLFHIIKQCMTLNILIGTTTQPSMHLFIID